MKKRIIVTVFFFFAAFLIIFPSLTKAAPSNNPIFATIEYVNNLINEKINAVREEFSSALQQINQNLQTLTNRTDVLEQKVAHLEARVAILENPPTPTPTQTPTPTLTPTPTPTPAPLQGIITVGVPIDTFGYSRIRVSINGQQGASALFYSNDQTTWTLQSKFGEDFGSKYWYVYPTKGRYYKVSNWGSPKTFYYELDNTPVNGPTADFTYSPSNPKVNQAVLFTDISTDGQDRKWEFGTPYTFYAYTQTVNLTPTQVGSFQVHLFAQNSEGIIDTKTVTVSVVP